MTQRINLLVILTFLAILSMVGSLLIGSTQLSSLIQGDNPLLHNIIVSIRLPRTLSAFTTGGLLALSGALMQVLLRNPLADPYVLGVSGGAAVSTLALLLLGYNGLVLVSGAWVGSLFTVVLVFLLVKGSQIWNNHRVLLTGIALSSGFSALISFILLISPDRELHGMLFWLMGDLSFAHLPVVEAILLLSGLVISFAFARELNILQRGEYEAKTLGVDTYRLQIILYLLSSGLTAAAVTLAGCIGFIGLIVPHILRLLGLHDYRYLVPACVLLGGGLLTCADTLARTLLSPQQLPVGILMALIGIPVFLFLIRERGQSYV